MILFLDFDGVLRPLHCEKGALPLIPQLERVLRELPSIEIVISSSWREDHELASLRSLFSLDIGSRIIGTTPIFEYLSHHHVRQAEIEAWLLENNRETESWIALDDDDWLFEPAQPNLILVDQAVGFEEKTEQAIRAAIASKL